MEGETSTNVAPGKPYDVFLSFRGPDTRRDFVDFLYNIMKNAGIHVYRDDDELSPGQPIDAILPAINNSRVCIPVFSENFASSAWCLREVARMVEFKRDIIPIFYHVTPDDVKLKTSLYKNQIEKLKDKHGEDLISQWGKALKETVESKGRELKADQGYYGFIDELVKELLFKLKVKNKHIPDYFVRRDDQIHAAMDLVNVGLDDVRIIGIYGTGGIGKTTLAKLLFNQLLTGFDCSCFLEDIMGELSRNNNSIEHLQQQLLLNLDPKLKGFGELTNAMARIQSNFQKKKVLVVLDNIDQKQHIDKLVARGSWFGSGSRIIVTTRDGSVFDGADGSSRNQPKVGVWAMEMAEMNPPQSLLLFSRHAFGRDSPTLEYEDLAKEVVATIGGLPLALEVIGSLLGGKAKSFWEGKIAELKRIVNKDVKENLRISFDALEISEQQIFLDIACFFINCETVNPIHMWEACELFPTVGINVLISRSLVKIRDGRFWMHDQLRILGTEIALYRSCKGPAEYYRPYGQKEALDMLKQKKGKENILGLRLDKRCDTLRGQDFADLLSLRFLSVKWARCFAGFHHPLPKLKWLSLHDCPANFDVAGLSSSDLVILDLSHSYIDENWQGWGQIQKGSLKILDLSDCQSLESTPTLSEMLALESLILNNCLSLSDLTDDLGYLEKLKLLSLSSCQGISRLPSSLGKLKSLVQLDLSHMRVTEWPESLDGLTELEILVLKYANIVELPEIVGALKSLITLDLSFSYIKRLPDSVGRLKRLNQLILCECSLVNDLPESLGDLESLTFLDLSGSGVTALPASVEKLKKLERLEMQRSKVAQLPPQIGGLSSLVMLNLRGASNIQTLPSGISKLSFLETLVLEECNQLRELPEELPESLTVLHVGSRALVKVPNLFRLSKLRDLKIIDGSGKTENTSWIIESSNLQGIMNLTRLEDLMLSISNLTALPQDLSALSALSSLFIGYPTFRCIPVLPSSLRRLTLCSLSTRLKLLNFSHLSNLESLFISGFIFTSISSGLQLPESLKWLRLETCQTGLFDCLPPMKNVIHLELIRCTEVIELSGFGGLESLETLDIDCCESLERIGNLFELKKRVKVTISFCPKLNIRPYEFTSTRFSKLFREEFRYDEKHMWEIVKQNERRISAYLSWWEFSKEKDSQEVMLNEDASDDDVVVDDVIVHDLSLLLSSGERDFLIRNDGRKVGISRVITLNRGYPLTLLFSTSSLVESQLFILFMKGHYRDEYADVFVFVSLDEDEESFRHHFSMMPWLAIPYSDSHKRSSLVQIFNVTEIPHLVILDEYGKVSRTKYHQLIPNLPRTNYPIAPELMKQWKDWKEASRKNQSLRSITVNGPIDFVVAFDGRQIPIANLEGKITGLYFVCRTTSCIEFNRRLVEVHEELKNKGEKFEILVLPHLGAASVFMETWKNFYQLPMNFKRHVELVSYFELRNVPALVILGRNGETLCSNAVDAVKEYGAAAYPFTAEKLAEMDREAVGWKDAAWRKQSLRSVLVRGHSLDDQSVFSFDGTRIPITQLEGKIVGLYFLHPSVSCIEFTLQLLDFYEKLKAKSEKFELVSVYLRGAVFDQQSFWGSFGTVPWLASQIGLARSEELVSYFEISTLPALVIIGRDGKILHLNAVDVIREHGVRAYPFSPEKLAQIGNPNQVNEEVMEANMLWPKWLQHNLHNHLLKPNLRMRYICDSCNEEGQVWSYYCEECDFDIHCKCASKYIRERSSAPSASLDVIFRLCCFCFLPFISFLLLYFFNMKWFRFLN